MEPDYKLLLRELSMRSQLIFPENDQDEIWFNETLKNSGDFMIRLFNAMDLTKQSIDDHDFKR